MDRMKIAFINVGYGESIYIECPDETKPEGVFTMLIDGGSAEADEYADSQTGRVTAAQYLRREGRAHLDIMVSTHIHEDHLCGLLPVTDTLIPGEFWQTFDETFAPAAGLPEPCQGKNNSERKFLAALRDYGRLRGRLDAAGCVVRRMCAGQARRELCPGLSVQVLGPLPTELERLQALLTADETHGEVLSREQLAKTDAMLNNFSMILLLEYRGIKILLPGDTNCLGYGDISEPLRADIFKVGHHGQRDGISEALLHQIQPSYVVCCASSDRRYGSADPEILELMRQNGAALYFSDCPIDTLPAHEVLTFTVDEGGGIRAAYGLLEQALCKENQSDCK